MNNLEPLKLEKISPYVPNYLSIASKEQVSLLDALVHLTEKEIEYKNEMASKIQINIEGCTFLKRSDE